MGLFYSGWIGLCSYRQIKMVEHSGLEPPTSSLRTRRSPSWANAPRHALKRLTIIGMDSFCFNEFLLSLPKREIHLFCWTLPLRFPFSKARSWVLVFWTAIFMKTCAVFQRKEPNEINQNLPSFFNTVHKKPNRFDDCWRFGKHRFFQGEKRPSVKTSIWFFSF